MKDIVIAFLTVSAVGLLVGALLALVARFFGVEENEAEKKIRAELPGINCGACGYKGCDDYAAAMARGEAAPDRCVPGAADVAVALANLLGVEAKAPTDMVAFVHCNGNCTATQSRNDYQGVASCRAAAMVYGGTGECRFGCLGLGDCAAACPADAICLRDGVAHIDTVRCLGCGLCTSVCPKHIIGMVPQATEAIVMCSNRERGAVARKSCQNACLGCGKCERVCPHGAVKVANCLAEVDYERCVGCGLCAEACPTGCLKKVYFPDASDVR